MMNKVAKLVLFQVAICFHGRLVDSSSHEYKSYIPSLPVPFCKPGYRMRYPTTNQQVVNIARKAIQLGTTVKAFGSRHSATDIICTNGIPIDMTYMRGMKLTSPNTTRVAAGETVRSVTEFLHNFGLGLQGLPAYGNITIGGAIGSEAHGSSLRRPSTISEEVVELLIVDGLGNFRRIFTDEDLRAFRVHLGLLGIILEITLRTVPLYKIKAFNAFYDDKILSDGSLINVLTKFDYLSVYWYPAYKLAVVSSQSIVDTSTPGQAFTNDHVPAVGYGFSFYTKRHVEVAQDQNSTEFLNLVQAASAITLVKKFPGFPPIYTSDSVTVESPAVGFYNKMLSPTCDAEGYFRCPWLHENGSFAILDQEFSVDLDQLPNVVSTVRDILKKYPAVFPYQGVLLRFSEKSETWMSVNYGRTSCHFEFYMPLRDDSVNQPSLGLAAYQAITQAMVDKFRGRPHWGKSGSHFHSKETMKQTIVPEAKVAFMLKVAEFDPHGIFMNSFGERFRGIGTKQDVDPNVKHCALTDVCVCSEDRDCAVTQKCSRITGYPNYPVCVTPGQKMLPVLNIFPFTKKVRFAYKFY